MDSKETTINKLDNKKKISIARIDKIFKVRFVFKYIIRLKET